MTPAETCPDVAPTRDAGISLVELLVAIALTAMVMTMVAGVFISSSRTLSREASATQSSETAAIAMREISRVLRAGTEIPLSTSALSLPVFTEAGSTAVTVHSFLDTGSDTVASVPRPVTIRFSVTADGALTETRWTAIAAAGGFWTFGTTPQSSRVIARGVMFPAVGSATPTLFSYRDATGALLLPGAGGLLTAAQIDTIASVTVTLTVQLDPTQRAKATELRNTVGIPNLGVSRVGANP